MNEPQTKYFMETQHYLQFLEFCEVCRKHKTLGLAIGRPGVGKTAAAKRYAQWHNIEINLQGRQRRLVNPLELAKANKLFYLPTITVSAPKLKSELTILKNRFDDVVERAIEWTSPTDWAAAWRKPHAELIIVDEAHRLRHEALEQLRDLHERWKVGIVLIGDPGMDRRLERQPHFSHRVAFVHQYRQLNLEEARLFIDHKLDELGLSKLESDLYSVIYWYTQGNFRMLNNLFLQISRLLRINAMNEITRDLIDTAREILLYGVSMPAAKTAK